jgi:Type I restriction-modification system methyltransferase subunit
MDNSYEYEIIMRKCFDVLRGNFNKEQSFGTLVAIVSMRFISENEKYSTKYFNIEGIIKEQNPMQAMSILLNRFENEFPEFGGILTGLLADSYVSIDKSIENKLKIMIQLIYSINFNSADEIKVFINELVLDAGVECGIYETPIAIKRLIIGLIDINEIKSFADYCSGISGIANYIYQALKDNEVNKNVFYYGEEINAKNYLISKLLLLINGNDNFNVVNTDVLVNKSSNVNEKFDLIVSDSPQSMSWNNELAGNDPRFIYGIPPKINADWAFNQNVLFHLNNNGKGIVIATKGTLVRSNESDIRKGVVEDDVIEAVISCPVNLQETTNVATEIIIYNKNKSKDRKRKILFINASDYFFRLNRNQNTISEEGINKIIKTYKNGIEEEHFSKFVTLDKIKEYKYTLNPIEYLDFDVLKNSFDNSVMLKEVARVTRGVQISSEDLEMLSKHPTHYLLNIKDIENGRINYDDETKLTNKRFDWLGKYDIKPGDIIITSKGWNVKIAVVEDDCRPAFISGNLSIIRVNTDKYNPYILYEFLQSEIGAKMLEGIQTGTTIKILNASKLEKIIIPTFDIEFMNEVGEKIKQNKIKYEKTLEEAEKIFTKSREKLIKSLNFK